MEHRAGYNCAMLFSWPLLSQQKTLPSLILAITRLPAVNNAICILSGGRPEQQALWKTNSRIAAAAKAITDLLNSHHWGSRLRDPCCIGFGVSPTTTTLPALFCWNPGSHNWTVTAERITLMKWAQLQICSSQLLKVSLWLPHLVTLCRDSSENTQVLLFFITDHFLHSAPTSWKMLQTD